MSNVSAFIIQPCLRKLYAYKQEKPYRVRVQATLFHPYAVVCTWGRLGTHYQRWRVIPAKTQAEAQEMAATIVNRKIRRGYEAHNNGDPV